MDALSGFLVGLLQGILEWLPVSSSGQSMLVLLDAFDLPAQTAFTYGIFMHVGTMAAVLVKYRRTWLKLPSDRVTLRFLAVATAFTAVSGLGVYYLFKRGMESFTGEYVNALVGLLLIATGLLLYFTGKKKFGVKGASSLSLFDTAVAGLAQGFTILPGISRSGVTVSALVLSELRQEEALRLSFLMSVPAVAGAVVLELLTEGAGGIQPSVAFAGLLAAFISGYLLMEALLAFAKRIRFDLFCMVFGALAVLWGVI